MHYTTNNYTITSLRSLRSGQPNISHTVHAHNYCGPIITFHAANFSGCGRWTGNKHSITNQAKQLATLYTCRCQGVVGASMHPYSELLQSRKTSAQTLDINHCPRAFVQLCFWSLLPFYNIHYQVLQYSLVASALACSG